MAVLCSTDTCHPVNLGQHTLKALFEHWLTGYKASTSEESDSKSEAINSTDASARVENKAEANNSTEARDNTPSAPRDTVPQNSEANQSTTYTARLGPGVVVGTARPETNNRTAANNRSETPSSSRDESDSSDESEAEIAPVVAPFTLPAQGHVMITEEGTGRLLFRAPIGELTGRERMIPNWVLDCLLLVSDTF